MSVGLIFSKQSHTVTNKKQITYVTAPTPPPANNNNGGRNLNNNSIRGDIQFMSALSALSETEKLLLIKINLSNTLRTVVT